MGPRGKPPLSILPLASLLRSLAITSFSSYPALLSPSLRLLSFLANSHSPLLCPSRNPVLHILLKRTFYTQYCAGETPEEVGATIKGVKDLGFRGVILAYGKETVFEKLEVAKPSVAQEVLKQKAKTAQELNAWKEGTLETVRMTEGGDFVALKFSGAGKEALRQLAAREPPSPEIERATTEVCELAKTRGVRLLFDAEQNAVQDGINAWTIRFQEKYNQGRALVYGTYQAYLQSAPRTLANHLLIAQDKAFVLGVKLVRGAYMASDPSKIFWASKHDTDTAYDGILEALLKREWNIILQNPSSSTAFPHTDLVAATHNQVSVRKALAIQEQQRAAGNDDVDVAYGQLMGMADEISCDLVQRSLHQREKNTDSMLHAYKYLVWGSVRECLKYLVRRAEENRDAVLRAKGSRIALRRELIRRIVLLRN